MVIFNNNYYFYIIDIYFKYSFLSFKKVTTYISMTKNISLRRDNLSLRGDNLSLRRDKISLRKVIF